MRFRKAKARNEGGGAGALKQWLEEKAANTLNDVAEEIGFVCMTRADDIYFVPKHALLARGIKHDHIIENVTGEVIRDWTITSPETGCVTLSSAVRPRMRAPSEATIWPASTIGCMVRPFSVPQSTALTMQSCATSTRRRVR